MNILDSSVYLAFLYQEPGGEFLNKLSQQCQEKGESIFMHQINFMEVIYKVKTKVPGFDVQALLAEFSSPWWSKINYLDSDLMLIAVDLKAKFQRASLADCIGLACTKTFKGTFWTADQLLSDIGNKENIPVNLIR